MRRVQVLAGAQLDLAQAVAFYRSRDERLVPRFVTVIDGHLAEIAEHPETWPFATGSRGAIPYRRLKVRGYPFGILYRLRGEVVEVVAVAHERRRPGYWARR